MIAHKNLFEKLPTIAQDPEQFDVLFSAKEYRERLIASIREAKNRIYLVALYLEDDEAGNQILTELYEAKQRNPSLNVIVCVDWHRAQRGLIGAEASEGNASMYKKFKSQYEHAVPVYGIPVRGKEVLGVLHLKGFIIDDHVIYSGASLNNIYLHNKERYRFDRYHIIQNKALSDCMVNFIEQEMISHPAVHNLAEKNNPTTKEIRADIKAFRASLTSAVYKFEPEETSEKQVALTPLVGIGKQQSNQLNKHINQLIAQAKDEIYICTPYFNFPKSVGKEVKRAIKRGVKINIIVGDKTANDFYIPTDEPFKTIGGLPYLYEVNLRRFAKANEAHIASRQLSIYLWKHKEHSFHLKGIWVDKQFSLITGNNLNPRAWKLDLENAIFIQDPNGLLGDKFTKEIDNILEHTQLVCAYKQLEDINQYPVEVQKLLRKITRTRADKILKQIL